MSSSFGNKLKIQIFGQSHSENLGVIIDGLPAGIELDMEKIVAFLDRRRGGRSYSTERTEADKPQIISGLLEGRTCGAPLAAIFANNDTRSGDYANLRDVPRPGHADYNAHLKYEGANDLRGGGHFSGRLTLPLCFAGAVAMQILEEKGIYIGAHIMEIAGIADEAFSTLELAKEDFPKGSFPVLNEAQGEAMLEAITHARSCGDSVGGVIECAIIGVPEGIGEPMFDGIENRLAQAVFAVPAIRGIEFGRGFAAGRMYGSEHNDPYTIKDGKVSPATNNAGGIVGGISTGAPILFRAAVKPTPSISHPQETVNIKTGETETLVIQGRHDPCIVPRAVPCIEAVAALVIYEFLA